MYFRLIHPIAGVVAEFASAHAMIRYFTQQGRRNVPECAEPTGMLFQVSQDGLFFHEYIDTVTEAAPAAGAFVISHSSRRLQ